MIQFYVDKIFVTHSENKAQVYSSLEEFGLSETTVTIDDIATKMTNCSIVLIPITSIAFDTGLVPARYGLLRATKRSTSYIMFEYQSIGSNAQTWRGYYNSGDTNNLYKWSGWKPIATAQPPQLYNLSLSDGIIAEKPCKYWRNQFGEVTVYGELYWASGFSKDNIVVATLPIGFRPATTVAAPATFWFSSNGRLPGMLYIYADGLFYARIWGPAIPAGTTASMYISASFVAAP